MFYLFFFWLFFDDILWGTLRAGKWYFQTAQLPTGVFLLLLYFVLGYVENTEIVKPKWTWSSVLGLFGQHLLWPGGRWQGNLWRRSGLISPCHSGFTCDILTNILKLMHGYVLLCKYKIHPHGTIFFSKS